MLTRHSLNTPYMPPGLIAYMSWTLRLPNLTLGSEIPSLVHGCSQVDRCVSLGSCKPQIQCNFNSIYTKTRNGFNLLSHCGVCSIVPMLFMQRIIRNLLSDVNNTSLNTSYVSPGLIAYMGWTLRLPNLTDLRIRDPIISAQRACTSS